MLGGNMLQAVTTRLFIRFLCVWAVSAILAVSPGAAQQQTPSLYPPTDRPWSSADYISAVGSIKSGQVPLPELSDPSGKRLFERIISMENIALAGAGKTDLAMEIRMPEAINTFDAGKALLMLYVNEAAKSPRYERETAKLLVYVMTLAKAMIGLSNEFITTIRKDDKYETRMAGVKMMHQGLRGMFAGLVQSIADTRFYSKASTLELIRGAVTCLPAFQPVLTSADRQDFQRLIQEQLKVTRDADIKKALGQMGDAIGS